MSFWGFFRKKDKVVADSSAVFVPMTTESGAASSDTVAEPPTGTDTGTATTTDSGSGFFGGDGGASGGGDGGGSN
ncbi:MAG: hypothetical protein AAB582_02980 [Patescibacteria group bacterium]